MQPDILERQETMVGQALFFGLLGRLLYTLPDREWYTTLFTEGVFEEAPFAEDQPDVQAGLALLRAFGESFSTETFEDLRADYTRLLVGVGKVVAPIWESVHFGEDRMVFQEQTLQVRAWYARFGLEAENLHHEPDDHLGLELSFVAHLAQLAAQALAAGNEEQAEALIAAQRDFLNEHPLRWAYQWCDLVDENARTGFYQGLSRLVRGALRGAAAYHDLKG
jgi:putative dimethyl sulfoxide reductase chaperone